MKIFTTAFFFITVLNLFAQQNIADVRKLPEGQIVTVTGIVTNGSELGIIRYLQDRTGGLAVYDYKLDNVKRGDSITVKGKIQSYNNLFEITNVSVFTLHSSNHKLPEPLVITIDEIGEDNEGQLVNIEKVEIENAGGTFSGNTNYTFTNGNKTGELRINSNSPAVGSIIPTGKVNLVAICSQYSFYPNDVQTGYQLLPRDMYDLTSVSSLNFTSPVQIDNITQNGFTLSWKTDSESTSIVKYGNSTDVNSWTESVEGTSVADGDEFYHEVHVTGIEPAAVIYAQAFSVSGSDTAFSTVNAFASQSESSGKIHVYFNTEIAPDDWSFLTLNTSDQRKSAPYFNGSEENDESYIGRAMADTLIAYINRAEESIDFCMYNLNNSGLSNVSDALNSAKQRGVNIRAITCGSTTHPGFQELDSEIQVLERPEVRDGGIMHNKFVIFDANSANPDKCWTLTGSTNISYNQVKTDANNMVFIQDQTLAKTFQIEFEEMWGSKTLQPNGLKAKFGPDKTDNTPHEFNIAGTRIECYFSPSDNTNLKIIQAINTSDNDLEVETMLITRTDLANAIIDAKVRGVNTQVVTNYSGDNTDAVNDILQENLSAGKFVFDDSAPGILHHKVAIIDARLSISDPQVITGSHNWSYSADTRNDENTLIIHDTEIANKFLQQFAFRFAENGGNLHVKAENTRIGLLNIYPNPCTQDNISIEISDREIEEVRITNILGKEVLVHNFQFPANKKQVQLNDVPNGIYLMMIKTNDDQPLLKKIIIAKEI